MAKQKKELNNTMHEPMLVMETSMTLQLQLTHITRVLSFAAVLMLNLFHCFNTVTLA